jgi:phosphoribosylamine--glycine ligase
MRVLIIGNGGREHAIAWKVASSTNVSEVFVAPGNGGTASEDKVSNINISATDLPQLAQFALDRHIDLTIVGPEAPLALGIVDYFQKKQLTCFGPSQAAAQLESSKAFCKDFIKKNNIPTAKYASFSEITPALNYLNDHPLPVVIKADGLAAGKGVIIAQSRAEAEAAVTDMLSAQKFGEAGKQIVIEEFLSGTELSYIVMVDGEHILPLASSQDHKRLMDGDQGPNTGGMGAYSPAPHMSPELEQTILRSIIQPTVRALKEAGSPFCGFLYAGLMIAEDQSPKVLEFNCRLGDPETQPLLMRLTSDLAQLCLSATQGKLDQEQVHWDDRAALGVVIAAKGYPASYRQGDHIEGIEQAQSLGCKIFQAGTKKVGNQIETSGGRVLCVTALGADISEAQQLAYQGAQAVEWKDCFYRRDIGHQAINASTQHD